MNVLSLFDGISCGQEALKRLGIVPDKYFASEVDKFAIKIAKQNFPNTICLGDVTEWKSWDLPEIDLLLAGSPCQGFSVAGKGLNFDDPRSKLFFTFVDILNELKPKYFLLENVKMKMEWQKIINDFVGVTPILINSSLVSAQNRERLYWTNIESVSQPSDRKIFLKDIVLSDVFPVALHNIYGGFKESSVRVFEGKSPTIRTSAGGGHIPSFVLKSAIENFDALVLSDAEVGYMNRQVSDGRTHWDFKHHSDIDNSKSSAVVANFFKGVPYNVFKDLNCIRKFHPIECERLQTLPDNYTSGISNTQRYKTIGNGWTIEVIVHILKNIKGEFDD